MRGGKDSCRIPFHVFQNAALVSGANNFTLNPVALSGRLSTEADAWALFRVVALRFRLHPISNTNAAQAAGFLGGVSDTNPTTIAQISELVSSCILTANNTHPTEWVVVPQQDLAGPLPWYKTIAGASVYEESFPGVLYIAGSTTNAFGLEVRGIYEFRQAVAAANTPAALQARQLLRLERERATAMRMVDALRTLQLEAAGLNERPGLSSRALPAAAGGGSTSTGMGGSGASAGGLTGL